MRVATVRRLVLHHDTLPLPEKRRGSFLTPVGMLLLIWPLSLMLLVSAFVGLQQQTYRAGAHTAIAAGLHYRASELERLSDLVERDLMPRLPVARPIRVTRRAR